MFKITKGSIDGTFDMVCYNYISEANFYTFLYSIRNKSFDMLADILQGRLKDADDLDWIIPIVSFTNQPAIIGEDGILRAVPLFSEKGCYANQGENRP